MWGARVYQMHLSPVKCNGAAIRKRRWWHYCIKQLSTPMIISAIWMQRSSEQDAGIATKTGLQGGRRQGDGSKQHQVTATLRDGVRTFTRTNKHKDWILLTSFCDNQILFHSASANSPHDMTAPWEKGLMVKSVFKIEKNVWSLFKIGLNHFWIYSMFNLQALLAFLMATVDWHFIVARICTTNVDSRRAFPNLVLVIDRKQLKQPVPLHSTLGRTHCMFKL